MISLVREGAAGDAALVAAALGGDGQAFASLFDGWFDRCFDVAFRILRNRDAAAEVTQEVFLGVWRDLATLRDHNAFGGWVLRTSRNRALNRLERERRTVALGNEATASAADAERPSPDAAVEALSGTGADLVWAAAAALGERDASILDLHLRHGMGAPEVAEALHVTPNHAHQLLFRLRGKLADALRSFVLWHQDRPACPELQDALHRAGLQAFGSEAAKLAQRHATTCERCGERQRLALAPEALFAGVPLVVAGPELRGRVISSLRDLGVPVGDQPQPVAPPPPPPPEGRDGPGDGDDERARARRATRRGVLASAVLAALLLAGGAILAVRRDEPPAALQETVLASLEAGSSSTTMAALPVVGPSTTATAPPATTAPPPSPGATTSAPPRRPVTSTSTAPSTTSTTAAGRPVVQRFTATSVKPPDTCARDEQPVQLAWATTGATGVTIVGPGAPDRTLAPSSSLTVCAPASTAGPVYVLTATGPGGTVTAKDGV